MTNAPEKTITLHVKSLAGTPTTVTVPASQLAAKTAELARHGWMIEKTEPPTPITFSYLANEIEHSGDVERELARLNRIGVKGHCSRHIYNESEFSDECAEFTVTLPAGMTRKQFDDLYDQA